MNLARQLIPAALMLVCPVPRTAVAGPLPPPPVPAAYTVRVETTSGGTMTITGPGVAIVSRWGAGEPLSPFVPYSEGEIDGTRWRWNSDGYSGLVIYSWLYEPPLGRTMILAARTLVDRRVEPAQAVYLRAINDRDYTVETVPGGWIERRTCDLAVLLTPWPFHPGDANSDGTRSPSDLWYYTAQYIAQQPQADFTGDGAITSDDLFGFLAAYFGG